MNSDTTLPPILFYRSSLEFLALPSRCSAVISSCDHIGWRSLHLSAWASDLWPQTGGRRRGHLRLRSAPGDLFRTNLPRGYDRPYSALSSDLRTRSRGKKDLWPSVGSSFLLGLSTLFRPALLATAPVLFFWLAVRMLGSDRRPLNLLVATLFYVLMILPLASHQYYSKDLVKISQKWDSQTEKLASDSNVPPFGAVYLFLERSWQSPVDFWRRTWREFCGFWEFYPTRLWIDRKDASGEFQYLNTQFSPSARNLLSVLSYGPELGLALLGLVLSLRSRRRGTILLLGIILSLALGYSIFVGKMRYRIPILPEMFIFAGAGAMALGSREFYRPLLGRLTTKTQSSQRS